MKSTHRFISLSVCLLVASWPEVCGAADAKAAGAPKADPAPKPQENTFAVSLLVSATGVTDLSLQIDARSRAARPLDRWNRDIRFGLKLRGPGPIYREFEVRTHGADYKTPSHEGTVTIDPQHQWVVIDLHEVVSKPGEPRRTEPCAANGRYPVEAISAGTERLTDRPGLTPGSGPTPAELAVPVVPNGPYVQPR